MDLASAVQGRKHSSQWVLTWDDLREPARGLEDMYLRRRARVRVAKSPRGEVIARYYEMPFLIRRRRHDEPSAERVRLTERTRRTGVLGLEHAADHVRRRDGHGRCHRGAQTDRSGKGDLRERDGGVDHAPPPSEPVIAVRTPRSDRQIEPDTVDY
jgi:hypothetical protein